MFLNETVIREEKIGTGDEVFMTGLFVHLAGKGRNIPIVRTGNLAMLPTERVPTALGDMDAYLIEARSIGGLSGSPVFVRETINLKTGDDEFLSGLGPIYLLGVIHGHWDIPPDAKNDIRVVDETGSVNMGVAIVTPASKLLDVINQDELMEARRQAAEDRKRRQVKPTMDLALPKTQRSLAPEKEDRIDIPVPTRQQFTEDLAKVTRRKKQGD
jgi:hypothetical protein